MVYASRLNFIIAIQAILWVSGCTNIGSGTIARDRFDYVDAISDSWKRQTLLNTVKMRYADASVVSLIQSRWQVDMVLRICVQSVSGMYNRTAGRLTAQPGDRDFYRLIDMLKWMGMPDLNHPPHCVRWLPPQSQ